MNAITEHRSLEYHACKYGSSKLLFRGPAKRLRGDYFAFLGSTETFGRFTQRPFPELIEDAMGIPTINLGCIRAGIDTYMSSSGLIDICSMAQVTVVQIVGAPNMSNRFYKVDPRHNERFFRAAKPFKQIYPEVDFSEFDLTSHMLTALARVGPERLHLVRHELQCAWVARMRTLLGQIDGKKILLWLSDHAPFSNATGGTICRDPLFIDRAMLNAVKKHADALVEVVGTKAEIEEGQKQLIYSEMEYGSAQEMLGPIVHQRAADALEPVLAALMNQPGQPALGRSEPLLIA